MYSGIVMLADKKWVIPAVTGVVSFAGGVGAGYLIAKKVINDKKDAPEPSNQLSLFDDVPVYWNEPWGNLAVEEPSDGDAIEYSESEETNEGRAPTTIVDYSTVSTDHIMPQVIQEPQEPITINVFEHDEDDWDYRIEVEKRALIEDDGPYIIHYEEFDTEDNDCRQETLTYYAGDDILADQTDQPVYNYKSLLGELNFGHGSGDPNVVYIRNMAIKMEWEVLLHTGTYSEEVLGLQIEQEYEAQDLKHSYDRKFRSE